jgi:hypothetical protein
MRLIEPADDPGNNLKVLLGDSGYTEQRGAIVEAG